MHSGVRRDAASPVGGRQTRCACISCSAARRIDAERAWQIGLLSVPPVPSTQVQAVAADLAAQVAGGSRTGLANMLDAARPALAPAALSHEAALAAMSISSRDGQEGISSFADRRAPVFHQADQENK